MAIRSESALRRWALVAFGVFALLTVLTVALSDGIAGRPGLTNPDSSTLDVGTQADFAALAAAGLILTWLRPRNSIGWLLTLAGLSGRYATPPRPTAPARSSFPRSTCRSGPWRGVSAPLWVPSLLIPPTLLCCATRPACSRICAAVSTAPPSSRSSCFAPATACGPAAVTDEVIGQVPPAGARP